MKAALRSFILICFIPLLSGCAVAIIGGTIATTAVILDSRSVDSQMGDSGLRLRILNALNQEDSLDDQRIRVVPYNGDVILIGQVSSESQKQRAEQIAREVGIPQSLFNQLQVTEISTVRDRSRDSWITTRVKSQLLRDPDHDASGVKVITENREVYLLGLVEPNVAQHAIEVARNVPGVVRVVDVLNVSRTQ
ncbi:MAG: BON domain-containing protein [Idiomarina sp.]|nr:BON domain-containing protein [Idiomarina sp.]